jgi:hypothetical protein
MIYQIDFFAFGHPNINTQHKTTLMITKDNFVTQKGDCIVAIAANIGLSDFPEKIKKAVRRNDSKIILTMNVDNCYFEIRGNGHPKITYNHPTDIVSRKSAYVCDRTLMVLADKSACDIPFELLNTLRNKEQKINFTLLIICDTK